MPQTLDLSSYRRYFPALAQNINGKQAIYFDNPGGTQVAQQVIDAMVSYLREANANTNGALLPASVPIRLSRRLAAPWPIFYTQPVRVRSSSGQT